MNTPTFPPLMSGHAVDGQDDPFQIACQKAELGCDAGLVVYNLGADHMSAALIFAPEVALAQAMAMLPACGVGFQNALGALAPPEVAVHLEWGGAIRVNGARCGQLRVASSTDDPGSIPNWLVVGLSLRLWPASQDTGVSPDKTALYAEGCTDVTAPALLEAWTRHCLHWITRWEDDNGPKALHTDWRGLVYGIGETVAECGQTGQFLGVDEDFGLLLRETDTTRLIPLTTQLETS